MNDRSAQALVFYTSASVLVLEILAGRLMAPYVGVSIETFTGIIGTILAGIALGSALGGRLADRYPPATLIGPALMLGGVLSWISLPVVAAAGPSFGATPVAIVMLALLAFFTPAAVLSAISPMVAKLRVDDLERTGSVVGGLSAAGTTGALFGTFITGFVLVSAIATRPIIIGLGASLVAAGAMFSVRLGAGTRPGVSGVAIAVVAGGLAVAAGTPCEFESAYFCGSVVDDPDDASLKFLVLDDLRHAAVDLDDPSHLEFRYTRLIGDAIDALPAGPVNALHVGGGGFTMPRYIEATRSGSTSVVLEIDPVLLDVAREELGLVTSDALEVRIGDARLALDELDTDSFDLVVGDAFAGKSVPWHLTTSEFIAEIDRVLAPDGLYVMNVIDGASSRFARAELATLQHHFDHIAAIHPTDGVPSWAVNQILIASDMPIPTLDIAAGDGIVVDDIARFVGGARVLTDDFAPVDWLTH